MSDNNDRIVDSISAAVNFIGAVAGAIFPESQVLGMTIKQLTAIGNGVAAGEKAAVEAFEQMKAVEASGADPTPEQLASWARASDAAHIALQGS